MIFIFVCIYSLVNLECRLRRLDIILTVFQLFCKLRGNHGKVIDCHSPGFIIAGAISSTHARAYGAF